MQNKIQKLEFAKIGEKTTIALLTTTSGFEIVGTSACLDPKAYDEEIGKDLAAKDALLKLAELEAYKLAECDVCPLTEEDKA